MTECSQLDLDARLRQLHDDFADCVGCGSAVSKKVAPKSCAQRIASTCPAMPDESTTISSPTLSTYG